ncbi:MAG: hypothetical protein OEN23_11350 [Paracoccaceae bacterium]|nr:hypothetical protein [Paracoccaceae bacterium]
MKFPNRNVINDHDPRWTPNTLIIAEELGIDSFDIDAMAGAAGGNPEINHPLVTAAENGAMWASEDLIEAYECGERQVGGTLFHSV